VKRQRAYKQRLNLTATRPRGGSRQWRILDPALRPPPEETLPTGSCRDGGRGLRPKSRPRGARRGSAHRTACNNVPGGSRRCTCLLRIGRHHGGRLRCGERGRRCGNWGRNDNGRCARCGGVRLSCRGRRLSIGSAFVRSRSLALRLGGADLVVNQACVLGCA